MTCGVTSTFCTESEVIAT